MSSNRLRRTGLCAAVAFSLLVAFTPRNQAHAGGANILVYWDYILGTDYVTPAISNLGHNMTFASSFADFNTRLAGGGFDLAMSFQQNPCSGGPNLTTLSNYVAGGGRVIYADWTRNPAFGPLFQTSFLDYGTCPTTASNLTSCQLTEPALAAGITNPMPLNNTGWFYSFSYTLDALAGAVSGGTYVVGGADCLVIGNGGRTVVLGFLSDIPGGGVQFFENLIGFVLGLDSDKDGIGDEEDNCPQVFNPLQEDGDFDGVGNVCDNCPDVFNPGQEDANEDDVGDACTACVVNTDCADGNACSIDFCDTSVVGGRCLYPPVEGCCNTDAQCNDANACTTDTCSGPGGTCTHDPITNCCNAAEDCDDGNMCTADTCDLTVQPGVCVTTPVPGCCNEDGDCDDGDACTIDACDTATGMCMPTTVVGCCNTDGDCNDGDTCTTDICSGPGGTCSSSPVVGCCTADASCADGNPCTADTCNVSTSTCANPLIPGCCLDDAACDDGDACTTDSCVGNVCVNEGECDAGTPDAALPPDAAPLPPDAAPPPDAADMPDSGGGGQMMDIDAGDAGDADSGDDGCCSVAGQDRSTQTGTLLLLLLVGAVVARRRRSR